MTQNDDLFSLIKSLSPSEKRQFKKQHDTKLKYVKLFKLMDKQTIYDEKTVQKRLKISQITFTKNTLSNKILDFLRINHQEQQEGQTEQHLKDLLLDAQLLYDRQLLNQLGKILRRAKKLAEEEEQFDYLLPIIRWQRKLILEKSQKNVAEELTHIIEEETVVRQKMDNLFIYKNIHDKIFLSLRMKMWSRDDEQKKQLTQLLATPLLQHEDLALSTLAKIYFHTIHGYYALRTSNSEAAYEHYKNILDLYESKPSTIYQHTADYRKSLCNFLNSCHILGKLSEYPPILEKLALLPCHSLRDEVKVFQAICHHELLYYLNTCAFDTKLKRVQQLERQLPTFEPQLNISRLFSIYFNLMLFYYFSENYEKALNIMNKIIQHPKNDLAKDVRQVSVLLQLVVHYELDNIEQFDNLYRRVHRHLKQENALGKFETMVLQYFKKLDAINIFDKQAVENCYQSFYDDLQKLQQSEDYTTYFIGLAEILCWLESKLNKQSLATVIQSHLQ